MSTLNVGAHKSASGGFDKAVTRAADIGGNNLQLFSYSPRSWQARDLDDETKEAYSTKRDELGIDPVIFHACYLINLADRGQTGEKSVKNLIAELNLAREIDCLGSVIHTGSWKTDDNQPEDDDHYQHLLDNIQEVLARTPEDTALFLENSGNEKIGREVEELYEIINDIGNPRLKVCLDTCHLHAAGIDISTEKAYDEFFNTFDEEIGLDRLGVIHVNDSKDEFGSLRDRHENIGEGNIPEGVFSNIVNKSPAKDVPLVIETPGFGDSGPDRKNLKRLRAYSN
jgi:deoxyribonuclease-4